MSCGLPASKAQSEGCPCVASVRAGSIAAYNFTVALSNCSFAGSSAVAGAADAAAASEPLQALGLGDGFAPGCGGAVYGYRSSVAIEGSQFQNNSATTGGAVHLDGAGVAAALSIAGATFLGNAADSGAAVSAAGGVQIGVRDSIFAANVATSAGAFLLGDGCSMGMGNSLAHSNEARVHGGVFKLGALASVTADGCSFLLNRAGLGGGLAFISSSAAVPAFLSGLEASPAAAAAASAALNSAQNNSADVWGPIFATENFTASVYLQPVTRTGASLSAWVTVLDGYGQPVGALPQSSIAVSYLASPGVLGTPGLSAYGGPHTLVAGVVVKGNVSQSYTLEFTVNAALLPAPLVAFADVAIAPCNLLEARTPGLLQSFAPLAIMPLRSLHVHPLTTHAAHARAASIRRSSTQRRSYANVCLAARGRSRTGPLPACASALTGSTHSHT